MRPGKARDSIAATCGEDAGVASRFGLIRQSAYGRRAAMARNSDMVEHPDIDILARSELFRGVPLEALRDVQAIAFRKRFAAGETVFRQDDAAATLYVVVVGRLRATQSAIDGQQIIIRYLGLGDVAGYAVISASRDHGPASVDRDECREPAWGTLSRPAGAAA